MASPEPALRLARATVFAVVCLAVSAGGHAFAGGAAVAPAVVAAGWAGALALAYALTGRERGPLAVLGATIGAQAALHELFAAASPSSYLPGVHGHVSVGMPAAHLIVGVLTGWWLYRGESAFWLMARLWGRPVLPVAMLAGPLAGPLAAPPPVRQAAPGPPAAPRPRRTAAAPIHRRGPPAGHPAG